MIKKIPAAFKQLLVCVSVLSSATAVCQNMLNEFKAMPALPVGAREAFAASKVNVSDSSYFYVESSPAIHNYLLKLQTENKPYQDIILAKGKAGTAPGLAAANDFSDLNSPETQAKLAKMSQEEKIKFAMEIQARMKTNKNLQTVNALNKPSPLMPLVLKLSAASQSLVAALPQFPAPVLLNHSKCNMMCDQLTDPTCTDRISKCDKKLSRDYHNAEIERYTTFIKNALAQYNLKKDAFEKALKEFDDQAGKYPKTEVAADYSNVFSMLMTIATVIEGYEKQGAMVLVEAKNDPYIRGVF